MNTPACRSSFVNLTISCALLLLVAAPGSAQPAGNGEAVFERACAACHRGGTPGAPTPDALRQFWPEAIVTALTSGRMQIEGSTLTEADRRAVAEFLTGKALGAAPGSSSSIVNRCPISMPLSDPSSGPAWNGWGNGVTNTRFARNGSLSAADLPRLKLKWAFGYYGISSARAQPTLAGGRLFVASENGEVHALDPKTGCSHWTFKASTGVRSAISIGPYKDASGSGYAAYFGDLTGTVHAVDANSGQPLWTRKVDSHPAAGITGAPTVYGGRVFVTVQGMNEEGYSGKPGYECCRFRGSVTALDANTGAVLWKTYTIDEPKPRTRNKEGVQMWGPAGGGIWAAATVDAKRGAVYVATGNGYADPPQPMTDAIIALDLQTGRVRWAKQMTPNDNWTMGCPPRNTGDPRCPEVLGPDHDFSASPALAEVNDRDILVVPQKSGMMYALDPDKEGAVVWQQRIGQGSGVGGQWGAAVDDRYAYVGVSDMMSQAPGGMRAVRLSTGEIAWSVGPQKVLCDASRRTCRASQGAAVTTIPGAVLSGSLDGGLRVYAADNGEIIWSFDTNREFETVNGVKANGGGLEGPGPIVAGGMLFVNSGYGWIVGNPGNVLLAFGVD